MMTEDIFENIQHALITIYAPVIYIWLSLFIVACIMVAIWWVFFKITRRE
jgi:hypothetical protein